jgi:adenylate cyclase
VRRLFWPVVAGALALLCVAWQDFYNEPLELFTYDLRQRLIQHPASTPVILGSIDEKSQEVLGPWPWPRQAHALLLENLYANKAEAVFLDLMLEEPKPGDQELARALKLGFSIIGGRLDRIDGGTLTLVPPASALRGAAEVGLLHRLDDEGGGVRFGLIAVGLNTAQASTRPYLAPGFQLYLHSLKAKPEQAEFFIEGLPLATALANVKHLEEGEHPGQLRIAGLEIPLMAYVRQRDDAIIMTLPVRYHQPATGPGPDGASVVPYVQLPETPVDGGYVVIGENTDSNVDLVTTPVGAMKGLEVHAQTFQSLADGSYLRLLSSPRWLVVAVALLFAVVLAFAPTPRLTLLALLVAGVVYSGVAIAFFQAGWWLPLAAPLLVLILATVFLLLIRLTVARAAFAEFAAPEAAAQMLVSNKGEELEAQTVEAIVVVTDIRGYTTLSETRTAVQMLDLLNEYHTATVAVYNRHGGRALTYQGDAQLVVFGYPKKLKDPGLAAVKACMELQQVCTKLRRQWGVAEDTFSVGAAVCRGQLVIGRLGAAESQIQYTVIGDAVRRAHKIQSMSDKLDSPVLVDAATVAAMNPQNILENLGLTEVDGMANPVVLHRPKS